MSSEAPRPSGWTEFNLHHRAAPRPPRGHALRLIEAAGPARGRQAVDLGCGNGVESLAIARAGWRVLAIDGDAPACEHLRAQAAEAAPGSLEVRRLDFATLPELPAAHLVYSGSALPFSAESFPHVWSRMRAALRPGGVLGVDLFGPKDSWAGSAHVKTLGEAEIRELLAGMELVELVERDEDGASLRGPKHWHVFSLIARASA